MVVLNKLDLCRDPDRARARVRRAAASSARVVECSFGEAPLDRLLSVRPAQQLVETVSHEGAQKVPWVVLSAERPKAAPGPVFHVEPHVQTRVWRPDAKVPLSGLERWLRAEAPTRGLVRAKGLIWVEEVAGCLIWQLSGLAGRMSLEGESQRNATGSADNLLPAVRFRRRAASTQSHHDIFVWIPERERLDCV